MILKEEKKNIEVEVINEEKTEDKKEEKKENVFSKFWNKTKKVVNDSLLEMKIESKFKGDNDSFSIYGKGDLVPLIVYGHLKDGKVIAYGKIETEVNNILVDNNEKAYYVNSLIDSTVDITVDGTTYTRPATIIVLDSDVQEVDVIKAGKKYYLQKK